MGMELTAVLRAYSFYAAAARGLQEQIETEARGVFLEQGSVFLEIGATCSHIALLGRGMIRVFIPAETGREVTLYNVGPGETCPTNLLCVLLGMKSPAIARAESDVEAVALPGPSFRQWVATEAVVREFVFEALATRLVDVLTLLEQVTFHRMDRRLADFLLARFTRTPKEPPTLSATHEQMALELGSAREVVSRLLKEFERMGAVKLGRGRVVLRDEDILRNLGVPREETNFARADEESTSEGAETAFRAH
jgi:CRP/FNR family transcriptional regulator